MDKRGTNPKSLANLRAPWKPGESGNPESKNLGTQAISKYMKALLEQYISAPETSFCNEGEYLPANKVLAMKIIHDAIKGDSRAREMVLDRMEGKLKQTTEIVNAEDQKEPFRLNVILNRGINKGDQNVGPK